MSATSVQKMIHEGLRPIHETPGLEGYTPEAITRWIRGGRLSIDGRRVRLEAVRYPQEWKTSEAAVARFLAALADQEAELAVA